MELQPQVQENTVTNAETADKPFQCNLCEASFKRKEVWQIHTYFVHKTYPCNACGISFTDEIKLFTHMVLVHAMRSELEFIASGMMDSFQDLNNLFHTDVCGDKEYVRKYREGPTGVLYFVERKTSAGVDKLINQDKIPKAKTCEILMDVDFEEGCGDLLIPSNNDHLNRNESLEQRKPKKTVRFLLNDTDNIEMNRIALSKHPSRENLFHSEVCCNEKDLKKPSKTAGRSLKFGESRKSDENRVFYREICERKNDLNRRTQSKKFAPVLLADGFELDDNRNENNSNEKTFVPLRADNAFKEENICKIPKAEKSLDFWSDDDDDDDDDSDSDDDDLTARSVVYQCNGGCNKIFTNMVKLVLHKRTHCRKKPFSCVSCWRSYNCAEKLAVHSAAHFRNTPYKCDVCNMAFTTKPYLFMHAMKQHKEESERCELCHKRFTEKYRLAMHVRIHYGEKPHECDICGSSFNWEAQLTQHLWAYHWGLKFK